ncbi:MAG: oligosaccharide flippase family protein [Kiritimatiellae bacterium]|jgi:O-antigen/teichoic acid export membrane protein|nr:oligosaccharide flippase family protein [Kiritimatiellia bacterium]
MDTSFKKIVVQIGSYGGWLIVSKSIGFMLLPLYTHYLTPADYGVLALLDVFATYFGIVVSAGFSNSLMRYYHKHKKIRWHKIVYSSCVTSVFSIGLIALSISLLLNLIYLSVSDVGYIKSDIIFYILITTFINSVSGITFTLLRVQGKVKAFITINAINLFISVSLNIVLIAVLGLGVYGFIYSGLISAVFAVSIQTFWVSRYFFTAPSKKLIKLMVKYSSPYILTGFVNAFTHNMGIICLTIVGDLSQTGIYAVGQKIASIVGVVGSSIALAWTPHMFKISNDKDSAQVYAKSTLLIFTFMLFIGLCLTVVSGPIINLMTSSSYHSAIIVILPIAIGQSLFVLMPVLRIGINITNKTKYIPLISFVSVLIGFPIALYLSNIYGMYGVAWGLSLTWAINVLLTMLASSRLYSIPYDYKNILIVIFSFVMSIAFYYYYIHIELLSILSILIYILMIYVAGVFSAEIKSIMDNGGL